MKTRSVSAGTRVASMVLVGLGASLLAPAPTADAKITKIEILDLTDDLFKAQADNLAKWNAVLKK